MSDQDTQLEIPRTNAAPAVDGKKFEAKDGVLFITFMSTVCALFYEVGFFYGIDIDFFSFFSLQEHFVSAITALPATISIAVLAILAIHSAMAVKLGLERGPTWMHWSYLKLGSSKLEFGLSEMLILAFVTFFAWSAYEYYRFQRYSMAFILGSFAFVLFSARVSPVFSRPIVLGAFGAFFLMLLSFITGIENGLGKTVYVRGDHVLISDRPNGCELIEIVKFGEAGLLYLESSHNQVSFIRKESIKALTSVDWDQRRAACPHAVP
jgi:hypothetical protein